MSNEPYVFSRDANASVRLYFQHWMWRYQTGYILHPDVPTNKEGLKIADIACGTGIWLIELARKLPASAQLDGYDVSPAQFPQKEWWPHNVQLGALDALGKIPEHLIGTYDIVHVGLFVMMIRNENPIPFIENIKQLLKPGGYLQWDEVDVDSLRATPANPSIPRSGWDKWQQKSTALFAQRGITYRWISELEKTLPCCGLETLSYNRLPISNDIAKPYTDLILISLNENVENYIIPSLGKDEGDVSTPEEWRTLLRNAVQECQAGISLKMDMVVTVGRMST